MHLCCFVLELLFTLEINEGWFRGKEEKYVVIELCRTSDASTHYVIGNQKCAEGISILCLHRGSRLPYPLYHFIPTNFPKILLRSTLLRFLLRRSLLLLHLPQSLRIIIIDPALFIFIYFYNPPSAETFPFRAIILLFALLHVLVSVTSESE